MADDIHNPAHLAVEEALLLRRQGDMPTAIRLLYDALAANLADVTVVTTLATMLAESEQFERAERVFQRAMDAGVSDAALLLNYATFLAHSGRLADAVPVFRRSGAEVVRDLQRHLTATQDEALAVHIRQLATSDCNLARARLLQGQHEAARDLAERWLVCERSWQDASAVMFETFDVDAVDSELQRLHQERRAAPDMVAELVDQARKRGEPAKALRLAAEACGYLDFDWPSGLEGFDAVLAEVVASVRELGSSAVAVVEADDLAKVERLLSSRLDG